MYDVKVNPRFVLNLSAWPSGRLIRIWYLVPQNAKHQQRAQLHNDNKSFVATTIGSFESETFDTVPPCKGSMYEKLINLKQNRNLNDPIISRGNISQLQHGESKKERRPAQRRESTSRRR